MGDGGLALTVVDDQGRWGAHRVGNLISLVRAQADNVEAGALIGVPCVPSMAGVASLLGVAASGRTALLLPGNAVVPSGPALEGSRLVVLSPPASDHSAIDDQSPTPFRLDVADQSEIWIPTSGTTGPPKIVRHRWQSLTGPVRVDPALSGVAWFTAFPFNLYAGLQVVLHACLNHGVLVFPPEERDLSLLVDRLATARVHTVSGTPSFYRQLLNFVPTDRLRCLTPSQLTLGGEPAPQDLLDALHQLFPEARLTHIYASTELGKILSVSDGREGFPASFLTGSDPRLSQLKLNDGELYVRTPHAMQGYLGGASSGSDDGWRATRDLVEVRGDRVIFLGRRDDMINVGGAKVNPLTVEGEIYRVPFVKEVRVFGKRSSIAGEIVAAEVTTDGSLSDGEAVERLRTHCQAKLRPAEIPRVIRIVPAITRTAAGKIQRTDA